MNEKRKQGFLFFIPIFILFLCMTYMAVFVCELISRILSNTYLHFSKLLQKPILNRNRSSYLH